MNNKENLKDFQKLSEHNFHDETKLEQTLYTTQYGNLHNRGKYSKEFTAIGDIILKFIVALITFDYGLRTSGGITLSKQIIESNEIFGTKVIRIRLFHEFKKDIEIITIKEIHKIIKTIGNE